MKVHAVEDKIRVLAVALYPSVSRNPTGFKALVLLLQFAFQSRKI